MLSELSIVIQYMQELERLHILNIELAEQFMIAFSWIRHNELSTPNQEKMDSLITKIKTILDEVYSKPTQNFLSYENIRRKVTDDKSDTEVTVPK